MSPFADCRQMKWGRSFALRECPSVLWRGRMPGMEVAMSIQLTSQQQQALDAQEGELPRVVDPRTNAAYVLVPEADYEAVRAILDDERRQRAIRAVALRNAAGRLEEIP